MSAPDPARIAELTTRLAVWCESTGHAIDAAGRVGEKTAAAIIGKSPGTLKNWRALDGRLPFYRGSPVSYALADLARYIEQQRTNYHEASRLGIPTGTPRRNPSLPRTNAAPGGHHGEN